MRILFVLNRLAGGKYATELMRDIRRYLPDCELEFKLTRQIEDWMKIDSNVPLERYDLLVVCGGDGTLNVALPFVLKLDIPVAFLPMGTANDFARELGLADLELKNIARLVYSKNRKRVDVLTVNGRSFLTVGGLGLGAEVSTWINQQRKESRLKSRLFQIVGPLAYPAVAASKILLGNQSYCGDFEIVTPVETRRVEASLILICNQAYLGKSMCIAPQARNDDGVFEVVIVPQKKLALLGKLFQAKSGEPLSDVIRYQVRDFRIRNLDQKKVPFFADGEVLFKDDHFDIALLPLRLQVVVP